MVIDRHKLLFGPYLTPRFDYGAKVECEARGEITIVKLTDARIPWPVGRSSRADSPVLYGDLARAVRREAICAVRHWLGIGGAAIHQWRRAFNVPATVAKQTGRTLRAVFLRRQKLALTDSRTHTTRQT